MTEFLSSRWARRGRQVQFLNVSHWSRVPSSMPGNERETEKEEERESEVSSSSDRRTRQRKHNCLLHWQPMAIPASYLLNIKHKYNVRTQYVTIL